MNFVQEMQGVFQTRGGTLTGANAAYRLNKMGTITDYWKSLVTMMGVGFGLKLI